jgi:predicted NBD/HSP70 family sugar kinase
MYYIGIDLDKEDSRVAVLDDDGEVVQEARVLNASLEAIAEEYARSKAAIEATGNYYIGLRHTRRVS